jgi:hypothetical protein
MSEFSSPQVSPTPNVLFDPLMAGKQQAQTNQLQMQQIDLTAADHEQVGRLAAGLLNIKDPAARAQAYAQGVGVLQSQGLAKYAPPTLPDEQSLQMLVSQSLPVTDQYKLGIATPAGTTAAINAALTPGQPGYSGTTGTAAPGSVATTPSTTIEPAAFNNATAVRDGLIKRGVDPDTATALAANALHESVANPRTGRGDNGNSAGLFQWAGPRLQAYTDTYGHSPDGSPLDEQLDNVVRELKGSEAPAAAKIAEAQGPAAKAAAVSQYYLRPKDIQAEMQRRSATALQLQQQIGGGTTTASATPPGGVAARTGGTDTAGPGAGSGGPPGGTMTPLPPDQATAQAKATGQPVPVAGSQGLWALPNGNMTSTPPSTTTAAVAPPAPVPPPASSQASLPHASSVPTGASSPQYQQAMDLQRRAMILDAQPDPTGRLKTLAAGLRSQAALALQNDSVVNTQEGQLHTLTGKLDDPAKPLADYRETTPGSGIWVGGPGTEPKFQPPGRLIIDKAGDVWRTTTGGAEKLSRLDPAAVAALNEAAAAGTATGTAVAKQLPELMAQARNAASQEGQIDYATNQLREATKGGIPTGYFSQGLATAAAAAKSLGLTDALRAVGVNPEAVGNVQTAQKTLSVIGGAILRQALGPGSAVTDAKVEQFIHTQPGIETDPQALQRIMAWARSQFTYERELGTAAVAEAAKPENAGRLPPHFLAAYYRDHGFAPIYDTGTQEMQQPDGRQPSRETQAPQARVPQEGDTATGKDGHKIVLRGGLWVPQ